MICIPSCAFVQVFSNTRKCNNETKTILNTGPQKSLIKANLTFCWNATISTLWFSDAAFKRFMQLEVQNISQNQPPIVQTRVILANTVSYIFRTLRKGNKGRWISFKCILKLQNLLKSPSIQLHGYLKVSWLLLKNAADIYQMCQINITTLWLVLSM